MLALKTAQRGLIRQRIAARSMQPDLLPTRYLHAPHLVDIPYALRLSCPKRPRLHVLRLLAAWSTALSVPSTQLPFTAASITMVGQEPLCRVRKKHTRSRTGCLTCRERHVRCDEKRPLW